MHINLSLPSLGLSFTQTLGKYFNDRYDKPSMHEKIAFYLYLICKFLLAIPGFEGYQGLVKPGHLHSSKETDGFGPFVHGALYKGLYTFVDKKITDSCGGPLRIFQAWLYAYFPQVKPKYGLCFRDSKDKSPCSCSTELLLSYSPEGEDAAFEVFQSFLLSFDSSYFYPLANLENASARLKHTFL